LAPMNPVAQRSTKVPGIHRTHPLLPGIASRWAPLMAYRA